jgi:hypothetical protein
MQVREVLRSCAHEKVAEAALASIGGGFFEKVADRAKACQLGVGAYVARSVVAFDAAASQETRRRIEARMARADQPVLHGLQLILEQAVCATPTMRRQ